MANTTSGTVTFDKTFAIDEIIAEAYERIGSQVTSGYQLKSARRSLNILFQEWGNRGLHYWEVGDTNIDLIELSLIELNLLNNLLDIDFAKRGPVESIPFVVLFAVLNFMSYKHVNI